MTKELKTLLVRGRLVSAWHVDDRYEVSVLDTEKLIFLEGYARSFEDHEAAIDYADKVSRFFEYAMA